MSLLLDIMTFNYYSTMTPTKRVILEVLDYLKYQVLNDKCTMEELQSISDTFIDNLDIDCTTSDIAERYKQHPSNVRNVLSRNFMPTPKRRVYYNFAKFIKFIPKSWKLKDTSTNIDAQ